MSEGTAGPPKPELDPAAQQRPRPRPRPAPAPSLTKPRPANGAAATSKTRTGTAARRTRRRLLALAAAVVVAALIVLDAVLLVRTLDRADDVDRLRTAHAAEVAATAAAKTAVPALLSYDYRTLDTDLARAKAQTTGSFAKEYGQLLDQVIAPTAQSRKLVTKTSLQSSAVVRSAGDTVTLLVFLDQTTTSSALTTPRTDGSRATVEFAKVGDRWKISQLSPV